MAEGAFEVKTVRATVYPDGGIEIHFGDPGAETGKLARGKDNVNTFKQDEPTFVYFDVGRWGGNCRNFGLLCGDGAETTHLMLCEYHGEANLPAPAGGCQQIETLFDLVQRMGAGRSNIRVIKDLSPPRIPVLNTNGKLYVLIGDLHLPLVSKEYGSNSAGFIDGTLMGSKFYEYENNAELHPIICDIAKGACLTEALLGGGLSASEWFNLYLAADIFYNEGDVSSGAGVDLYNFLFALSGCWDSAHVHLVQVGDMYDFWIGLDRLFTEQSCSGSQPGSIQLINPGSDLDIIREWISNANIANTFSFSMDGQSVCLPGVFESLAKEKPGQVTLLYGNHENYFRVLSGMALLASDPIERRAHFFENDIYMEHGHSGDTHNCDGAISGHYLTQQAFLTKDARAFEKPFEGFERDDFLEQSVYRYTQNPFRAYIMAHTHTPYIAAVYVARTSKPEYGRRMIDLPIR